MGRSSCGEDPFWCLVWHADLRALKALLELLAVAVALGSGVETCTYSLKTVLGSQGLTMYLWLAGGKNVGVTWALG